MTRFPLLDPAERQRMLAEPTGAVRVIIDTDAANEIDDQFALTWALLAPERITVEAIVAAPYSFAHLRPALMEATRLLDDGDDPAASAMIDDVASWARRLHKQGLRPEDLDLVNPEEGMERSFDEIERVMGKLGLSGSPRRGEGPSRRSAVEPGGRGAHPPASEELTSGPWRGMSLPGRVFRGAPSYLATPGEAVDSPGARRIIDCAMESTDDPLYILAIGCVTNIASALLIEPEIARRIVVVWTSGYPTWVTRSNRSSLNLVQDPAASRLLFDSGVPLVYLPGYYLGAQLRLSLPEMDTHVRGCGDIGDYLHHLYTHNPIHTQRGIDDLFGRTWVIWDMINVAWVLDPRWVPTELVPTPHLGDDLRWHRRDDAEVMREAHGIDRDGIFRDFFRRLQSHQQIVATINEEGDGDGGD